MVTFLIEYFVVVAVLRVCRPRASTSTRVDIHLSCHSVSPGSHRQTTSCCFLPSPSSSQLGSPPPRRPCAFTLQTSGMLWHPPPTPQLCVWYLGQCWHPPPLLSHAASLILASHFPSQDQDGTNLRARRSSGICPDTILTRFEEPTRACSLLSHRRAAPAQK